MSLKRLMLILLAVSLGMIAGLLIVNSIQPQPLRPSKHQDPYLHPLGRTAE